MIVYIDQKVQDGIIVLSLTGINDSRIIIYPKDHSIACWKQSSQKLGFDILKSDSQS